jgi:hypothetical protein
MAVQIASPAFGGKLKTDEYYIQVRDIIRVMHGYSTLRRIALTLNEQGFTTPTGLPFTRDRLATFMKQNKSK